MKCLSHSPKVTEASEKEESLTGGVLEGMWLNKFVEFGISFRATTGQRQTVGKRYSGLTPLSPCLPPPQTP